MSEKEYIERGALLKRFAELHDGGNWLVNDYNADWIHSFIETAPAADVVSRGVFEQVKWERDMAMQQLEEHGIPFGAKADVVEVRYGEWVEHFGFDCWHYDCPFCDDGYATQQRDETPPNYCSNCGARLTLERKEQT